MLVTFGCDVRSCHHRREVWRELQPDPWLPCNARALLQTQIVNTIHSIATTILHLNYLLKIPTTFTVRNFFSTSQTTTSNYSHHASRRGSRLCTLSSLPSYVQSVANVRIQLISQCTSHFKLDSDRSSLLRISDSLSTLSSFRQQHISSLQSTLTRLGRNHQTLASNHSHTLSQHNPTTHASEILRLDTEKFKIAKQASDLEMEGERLEGELSRLGGVLSELEAEGVEGGEREKAPEEDATVLKLKVYRSLGVDVEADSAGQYNKAVIRNAAKGDVHVVNIDPKFSRNFYTNYFWRTM